MVTDFRTPDSPAICRSSPNQYTKNDRGQKTQSSMQEEVLPGFLERLCLFRTARSDIAGGCGAGSVPLPHSLSQHLQAAACNVF